MEDRKWRKQEGKTCGKEGVEEEDLSLQRIGKGTWKRKICGEKSLEENREGDE